MGRVGLESRQPDNEFYPDRILSVLDRRGVEYVLVGGVPSATPNDAATLTSFGSSTWLTDAGPLDLLVELWGPVRGRHACGDLVARATNVGAGNLMIRVASLDDVIVSKEYAAPLKDLDALPKLHDLRDRHGD